MDIKEFHSYLDLLESSNKKLRSKARSVIQKWEGDIQIDQMWRMKADDSNAICEITGINVGKQCKIQARVRTYNLGTGEEIFKSFYYGKESFLKKWERML